MLKKPASFLLLSILWVCLATVVHAQKDSLILANGDIIVGEIKSMNMGVLILETPYSSSDFKIKWKNIKEVYSDVRFLISLRDGRRMNSIIITKQPGILVIEDEDGELEEINILDLVFLKTLEKKFVERLNGSVDAGISVSKANHLKQINIGSSLGYLTDNWGADMYYTYDGSSQDSVSSTIREEGGMNFKYFLHKDWYILPEAAFLSNTEQALKPRVTAKLGAGRYFIHTNRAYWGWVGGLSLNKENFTNATPSKSSAEAYVGTELNMFDTGDLDLLTNLYVYPSLTESGRVRSDFKFDLKYEFYNDFYVKLNITYNYDNQPAIQGNESDYVYGFSVGWELE